MTVQTDRLTATQRHIIAQVRRTAPLVHCISAAVSMNFVADGLLAAGARPVMTETVDEAPAMTQLADALLINLGTLSTDGLAGIPASVATARRRNIPWVLDPTAVGVAPVRTALARELLDAYPSVIRGNASEILALGSAAAGRGADAAHTVAQAHAPARELAHRTGSVVAVSGPVDFLTDGTHSLEWYGGTELLPRVTGTGCLLGALTAACLSVAPEPFDAATTATAWLGVAGEYAAAHTTRPGSFKVLLLDALDEIAEACAP